jgi:hypothetical protein
MQLSPALQRWENGTTDSSPGGTTECMGKSPARISGSTGSRGGCPYGDNLRF